eukprot:gene6538-3183_t
MSRNVAFAESRALLRRYSALLCLLLLVLAPLGISQRDGPSSIGKLEKCEEPCRLSQRDALLRLFDSTSGKDWLNSSGWATATQNHCLWFGVLCCEEGSLCEGGVRSLSVPHNNLMGSLGGAEFLTPLSASLQILLLDGNSLTGPLPPSLESLSHLETLTLSFNNFSGSLPPNLGKLTSLTTLQLQANQLTSTIPMSDWSQLSALKEIDLSRNRLTGSAPTNLGLSNLVTLRASTNKFQGGIPGWQNPDVVSNRTSSLLILDLHNNQLVGSLRVDLFDHPLEALDLSDNRLTGSVPAGLFASATIALTGTISDSITHALSLVSLDISGNEDVYGALPDSMSSLARLALIDIRETAMHGQGGKIPLWLTQSDLAIVTGHLVCPVVSFVSIPDDATGQVWLDPSYYNYTGCIGGALLGFVLTSIIPKISGPNWFDFARGPGSSRRIPPGLRARSQHTQVTLVLTDVEGSTELWEWNNELMAEAIDLHTRGLGTHMDRFFGYEVSPL